MAKAKKYLLPETLRLGDRVQLWSFPDGMQYNNFTCKPVTRWGRLEGYDRRKGYMIRMDRGYCEWWAPLDFFLAINGFEVQQSYLQKSGFKEDNARQSAITYYMQRYGQRKEA